MEPEEVAEAFNPQKAARSATWCFQPQIKPDQAAAEIYQPALVTDQLQFSLPNSSMIQSGMEVNMTTAGELTATTAFSDFCRLNDITIQTWSPFQYGFLKAFSSARQVSRIEPLSGGNCRQIPHDSDNNCGLHGFCVTLHTCG